MCLVLLQQESMCLDTTVLKVNITAPPTRETAGGAGPETEMWTIQKHKTTSLYLATGLLVWRSWILLWFSSASKDSSWLLHRLSCRHVGDWMGTSQADKDEAWQQAARPTAAAVERCSGPAVQKVTSTAGATFSERRETGKIHVQL